MTILIPVYNGEKYISRAIESCLNQTHKDIEIVISNDGSTDNTENIVKEFKDDRIKYVKSESNQGIIKAIAKGLDISTREYIQLLAHDDYLSENYVEEFYKSGSSMPQFQYDDREFKENLKPLMVDEIVKNFYGNDFGSELSLSVWKTNELKDGIKYLEEIIDSVNQDEVSKQTRKYLKLGWGIDIILTLKLLTNYKSISRSKGIYYKNQQDDNLGKKLKFNYGSVEGLIGYPKYELNCLIYAYRELWANYLREIKVKVGVQTINSVIIGFIKGNLHSGGNMLRCIKEFFNEYSFDEIISVIINSPINLIKRFIKYEYL